MSAKEAFDFGQCCNSIFLFCIKSVTKEAGASIFFVICNTVYYVQIQELPNGTASHETFSTADFTPPIHDLGSQGNLIRKPSPVPGPTAFYSTAASCHYAHTVS
ncbi:hypothetical protein OUZ56_007369 [Daphnia magna]|uniref:Uncharacterized protein n=1 Tax=Daphnia magna TaxID=35525 RepID=A0ABR0AA50_9CRUS|nr:hypothetical protein OUZ56_007369 [Daphnia magna]